MNGLVAALGTPAALRRIAFANIVVNVVIVLTGGAVRLTGSGLGCPTWPRCTQDSLVTTPEMGVHGLIENGNRGLGAIVGLVAVAGVVVALCQRPRPRRATWYAVLTALGVAAQGGLGGVTVLTELNPWLVGGHFLLSVVVIATSYAFWIEARARCAQAAPPRPDGADTALPRPLRQLAWILLAVSAAVVVVGTVVTGAGPHAGDARVPRNGLDLRSITQLHVDLVFLLIGLSVAMWLAARAVGAQRLAAAAGWLLLAEVAQGVVGFAQYALGLPALIVGLHLAGACAVWLASLAVLFATRAPQHSAEPASAPVSAPSSRQPVGNSVGAAATATTVSPAG